MHLLFNGLFLIAGIKWGDWRDWSKYHSTILFLWFGDLLYHFLCYDYIMWEYKESRFGLNLLPNHMVISLLIMFVCLLSSHCFNLSGEIPKQDN